MALSPLSRLRELILEEKVTPEDLLFLAETLHTYSAEDIVKAVRLLDSAGKSANRGAALDAAKAETDKPRLKKA